MALSVTVHKLDTVLFPGDTFRCLIEFKNSHAVTGDAEKDAEHIEPLAWVSAQVYGQYVADLSLISLPSSTLQRSLAGSTLPKLGTDAFPFLFRRSDSNFTFLGFKRLLTTDPLVDKNGRFMYFSGAEILLCDLRLKPQESRSCTYPLKKLSFSAFYRDFR